MESVFGIQATGAGSQGMGMPSSLFNNDQDHQSEVPPTYDTQLFPGGISASTHSRPEPTIHPLLQSVILAPSNSVYQVTRSSRNQNSQQGRNHLSRLPGAGLMQREPDGSDPRLANSRTSQGTLTGWSDDGIPPDRSTEEFSVSFGRALNEMMDQVHSQAQSAATQNDDNVGDDGPPHLGTPQEDAQNDEADNGSDEENNHHDEEEDTAAPDSDEVMNEAGDSVEAPAAQEEEGEEDRQAAEVSSAMADGLMISQPAPDNPPTNPLIPTTQNDDNDDGANNDALMEEQEAPAESSSAGEQQSEQPSESNQTEQEEKTEQEEEHNESQNASAEEEGEDNNETSRDAAPPAEQNINEEDDEAVAEEEANNDDHDAPMQNNDEENNAGAEEDTNNDANNGTLTCPADIDPEVFNSLPLEMQQEIVQQHEVEAQISESGLDPEALAALPEEMRREVIQQEQQERSLREQQAAQPAADPANAEEMDNASFLASLTPDLRQEILLTADDTFIASLPPNLVNEANILRERVTAQHRQAQEQANAANALIGGGPRRGGRPAQPSEGTGASRRRLRNGKLVSLTLHIFYYDQ